MTWSQSLATMLVAIPIATATPSVARQAAKGPLVKVHRLKFLEKHHPFLSDYKFDVNDMLNRFHMHKDTKVQVLMFKPADREAVLESLKRELVRPGRFSVNHLMPADYWLFSGPKDDQAVFYFPMSKTPLPPGSPGMPRYPGGCNVVIVMP
jgi:hypothetical protein